MLVFKYNNVLKESSGVVYDTLDDGGGSDYSPHVFNVNDTQSEDAKYLRLDCNPPRLVNMKRLLTAMKAIGQDLAANYRYIYEVYDSLDVLFTDNPHIQTMATDSTSIFINPVFAEDILERLGDNVGIAVMEFIIIHECFHVLFGHCKQFARNHAKFPDALKVNYAQDYEINYVIENFIFEEFENKFKGITKIAGGLINDDYGEQGLTWEEIYDICDDPVVETDKIEMSNEWKKGFTDGYNAVLNDLKAEGLLEKYNIN